MRLLSVFADEAGQQDMSVGCYPLTIVTHDQANPIDAMMADYEASVRGDTGRPMCPATRSTSCTASQEEATV